MGDSLASLAESMVEAGFEADKLVVVGMDAAGHVRVSHNCGSIAEVIGMLELAQAESTRGLE